MWIFTADGFFSAVENREDKKQVVVRARSVYDIYSVSKKLKVPWKKSEYFSDYPYRLFCSKEAWADYVSGAALDIDYDNFKSRMATLFDSDRLCQLHEVWEVMGGGDSDWDFHEFQAKERERTKALDRDFDSPLHR